MTTSYRLLLLEDDQAFAGALVQALNKQNLYSQRIDILHITYKEYEDRFGSARNSSKELIVLGGRESLDFELDQRFAKSLASQLERARIFLLTSSTDAKEILGLWQPGVYAVLERNLQAHFGLVKAIQRLQFVQQPRSYSRRGKSSSNSIWKRFRKALNGLFM